MGLEDFQHGLSPPWLRGPNAEKFIRFTGTEKDVQVLLLKEGIKARWITHGPDDALLLQGADSDLERYDSEINEVYRARLLARWETWHFAGTKKGVIDSLRAYGIEDVRIKEDWEWDASPGEWYSRFWVILGPALPWSPQTTPFTTPATQGSTATFDEVRDVKRQIIKWKAAHGMPVHVILAFPGAAMQGLDLKTPFSTGPVAAYWPIGKFMAVTLFSTPFTTGDFLL